MRYFTLIALFTLFSCGNKEDILLPKANITIVKNVDDLSPIYIFFRTKGNDTLVEVNRKNSIISTNWILNVDKRLPLRLAIPEIMKLQQRKREEKAHKNEKAENYYSYADTIGKNVAFIPFTNVYYRIDKPLSGGFIFYFKKDSDLVLINNIQIKKSEVLNYVYSFNFAINPRIELVFDKNMSFEEYLQIKILTRELDTFNKEVPEEYID
ncbi:hypothetical protein E0I61_11680 [Flavobacterium ranwuense]|uniref:Lipoprotein n=1 Tax=Flavobacterium ranwuense TaxID=2541725 RepID=A0ABY2DQD1_9FLAO|nr:hypothetical protein [Flavobacterium ranwuense]TDE28541.1 hypothetical protein E0I61_11680 [Flavobacterium ranwuense]